MFDATTAARDSLWGLRGFGSVFKGRKPGENGTPRANRAHGCSAARVRPGLEVEDEPDRAVPPGSGAGAWDPPSAAEARRGMRAAAGCPSGPRDGPSWRWAETEKRRGRGKCGPRGGKKGLGQARDRGEIKEILFHFPNLCFAQIF